MTDETFGMDMSSEENNNNNEYSSETVFKNTHFEENVCSTENADVVQADFEEIHSAEHTQSNSNPDEAIYAGGTYYTKNTDSGVANGYEWDASNKAPEKEKTKKSKNKSDRGFKVFIGVTLSIFTISVVVLALLASSYAFENTNTKIDDSSSKKALKASENFDYSNVTIDTPSFVAFDFQEREGQVLSIPEIAAKCSPSSVGIVSQIETTYDFPFYFSSPTTRVAEASGSGFIYSADGYIVTNHHVIENAKSVKVILYDNTELEATVVGSDSLSDIAVLKITPDENTTLIPMEIGNSDELVVGEGVVAIGCPAGVEFIGTVTDGIVSAINRNVELTDSYGSVQKTMTLIQTNATINHGNSGGPLINSRGQVIGINTLKLSADYEGIGFSIPMNGALPIISQLIEHGEVIERTEDDFAYGKGVIGINGSAISEDEAEYYGIPQGVLVVQINKGSSAANAGLRRGDIITHYNGTKVTTVEEINNLKGSSRAGTEVTLTIYRDGDDSEGDTLDITFKLDSQQ